MHGQSADNAETPLQECGLKTYLFSYGSYYSSLSLKQLSEMFELPKMQVMLGQDIHTMLMYVSCSAQTHSQDKASDQGMMSSSAVACLCKLWLFTCLALDMFAHGFQMLCDPFDRGVVWTLLAMPYDCHACASDTAHTHMHCDCMALRAVS